jgi:hypothetical protein
MSHIEILSEVSLIISNHIDEEVLVGKAKVSNPKVSPSKSKSNNFTVVMKVKNEKPVKQIETDKEKEKEKNERKVKRESVRQQIKAAKNKVNNPPMVFDGVIEDENAKLKKGIQRTPPKPRQPSPPRDLGIIGGGMVSRDDLPANGKAIKGPVQRSPPRKVDSNGLKANNQMAYNYSNINTEVIERKDKITRSPVTSNRSSKLAFNDNDTPPRINEKQMSVPLEMNPVRFVNEYRNSPDYGSDPANFEQYSPQNQNFYPRSPKTFQHSQDTTELHSFEDRVDDLLSETRNRLDEHTPKPDYTANNQEFNRQNGFYPQNIKSENISPEFMNESSSMNYNQMPSPQMMQAPMYGQAPYTMAAYYGPVPMNQNMGPSQQPMMQQPNMYSPVPNYGQVMNPEFMGQQQVYQGQPQQMMHQPNMYSPAQNYGQVMSPDHLNQQHYQGQSQPMMQNAPMGMHGQPMYQVYYPPVNQGSPQQPQYSQNQF